MAIPLRMMTYNIRSGRNLAGEHDIRFAADVINRCRPDVVGLNEVRSHTTDVPYDQADALGQFCGYYPVFGRSIDFAGGEYGNAVLTRLPLIDRDIIDIPDRFEGESKRFEHRTLLRCVLSAAGREIVLLQTHFGLTPGEQRSAVETTLSLVRAEKRPLILMGDLNMSPDDPILAPLFEALEDTAGGRAEPLTHPSGEPTEKIDYIMHSRAFSAQSLSSEATTNSDHRPLWADLCLR